VVHRCHDTGFQGRLNFSTCTFVACVLEKKDTILVLFRNGFWFLVSSYIKSQNNRYSSAEKLISIHKLLLHDVNSNVWFASNAHFVSETINSR